MKKALLLLCALLCGTLTAQNNDPVWGTDYSESCTALLVGKKASTDGSVMTSHSCDGNYRTWATVVPRRKFESGARDTIYWGLLKTEEPHDMRGVTIKGTIPAAPETFSYLNFGYPCLNEKQLAIGETTFGGKRELRNEQGLFLIEELQRIVLQRCTTARQAIGLIGELVEEYGFGDGGECLTFADPNEVWQLEIVGSGKQGKPTAMWVAQRVPDDHVGISANIARISDVDFNNPDYFMYSKDLRERAKKLGLWDGKEPFKFWKVIGTGKPFAIRDYYVMSSLAPSLDLKYDAEELPFSVKPDQLVSPQRAIAVYRENYEGSRFDMLKNLKVAVKSKGDDGLEKIDSVTSPIMNHWMSTDMRNLVNTLKPGAIEFQRTVPVCWCSYSFVVQCRSWLPDEIGAVAYFSVDNPAQSPRIPIYSGALSLPEGFAVCGQKRYREDSFLWKFREANRLAQVAWGKTKNKMESEAMRLEKKMFEEQEEIESKAKALMAKGESRKARELITKYSADFAGSAVHSWDGLKREFWSMFGRGF
ncbi:putative secreted peptidase [Mucinivorans hirudinis]|uniref:Dipeptidase n=1 Tax=Mucinivorans hirudinis TaxID=1433126 RepID=A0A060R9J2_9BACT|nr:putative secreted peptidase [Mucinivorans hirudinis]